MIWQEHALLKPPTAEEMALMEPEKLVELHHGVLKIRNYQDGGALVTVILKSE